MDNEDEVKKFIEKYHYNKNDYILIKQLIKKLILKIKLLVCFNFFINFSLMLIYFAQSL